MAENKEDIFTLGEPDIRERRTGLDRREFTYVAHIPERRSGNDRREDSAYFLDRPEACMDLRKSRNLYPLVP